MRAQSQLKSLPEIHHRPLVVGSLLSEEPIENQLKKAHEASVDILEVRLDTFPFLSLPFPEACRSSVLLLSLLRRSFKKPLLLTIRSSKEGGARSLTEEKRRALFLALLPLVDAVDVEIQSRLFANVVTKAAHRAKKIVIHSAHFFNQTPAFRILNNICQRSHVLRGDYVKLAVMPKNDQDMDDFLLWGKSKEKQNIVLIAMGDVGVASRYIGYSFGSCMTYGHLGRSAAPGQVAVSKLSTVIRNLYGTPRKK